MNKLNRRLFLKRTTAVMVAGTLLPGLFARKIFSQTITVLPDISVIKGTNFFENTVLAIKELGGMQKFVSKGQKVGLLINSDFEIPGAYTNPDVSLAVIKMCFDAGASEVKCLQNVKPEYWALSEKKTEMENYLAKLANDDKNQFPAKIENGGFTKKELPNSIQLKEAEVIDSLFVADVMINMPIAKHHSTTLYTGALKNMMGVNTRATNVFFHLNGPAKNDPLFIAQCIADINKMRPANLTVVDATSFITTGGPSGPGEVQVENKIIAGTNMVAIDALGCSYHGYEADEVPTLVECEKAGLGIKDFTKLKIVEKEV